MPNGHNETMEDFVTRRESEGTDKDCLCPHCGFIGDMRELVEHHSVCPVLVEDTDTKILLQEENDG